MRISDAPPGLFVTGTDTGVGKTAVTAAVARALVARGRSVGVLKPVATGVDPDRSPGSGEDAERLGAAVGGAVPIDRMAPIRFEPPLAPSVAARRSGRPLRLATIIETVARSLGDWSRQGVDLMLIEGVGGLLCPLAEDATVADLAIALDYPLLIVARRGLGTLNHTLLTVEAARSRGLRIAGVVLNSPEPEAHDLAEATNPAELSRWLGAVPILAVLGHHAGSPDLPDSLPAVSWMEERARKPRFQGEPRARESGRNGGNRPDAT